MSLSSSAPTVPRATVYLVNDGTIEGVDPKDRASMTAIMMPKGSSPTLVIFGGGACFFRFGEACLARVGFYLVSHLLVVEEHE